MLFLGKLDIPSGQSVNNHSTVAPFDLPVGLKAVYLESDTDAVAFEIGAGTGTGLDTFATTTARGQKLYNGATVNVAEGPFDVPRFGIATGVGSGAAPKSVVRIAAFNPAGGAAVVRVFAA